MLVQMETGDLRNANVLPKFFCVDKMVALSIERIVYYNTLPHPTPPPHGRAHA